MTVSVRFACSGCDAVATGTAPIWKRFKSFSGRDHGFGQYHVTNIESVTPPGWVAFDPYTLATYCPTCWAAIETPAGGVTDDTGGERIGYDVHGDAKR